jgi:hypothetical protein
LLDELGTETGTQLDMTRFAQNKFEEARMKYGDDAPELLVCKTIEEVSGTNLQIDGEWKKHWEA